MIALLLAALNWVRRGYTEAPTFKLQVSKAGLE